MIFVVCEQCGPRPFLLLHDIKLSEAPIELVAGITGAPCDACGRPLSLKEYGVKAGLEVKALLAEEYPEYGSDLSELEWQAKHDPEKLLTTLQESLNRELAKSGEYVEAVPIVHTMNLDEQITSESRLDFINHPELLPSIKVRRLPRDPIDYKTEMRYVRTHDEVLVLLFIKIFEKTEKLAIPLGRDHEWIKLLAMTNKLALVDSKRSITQLISLPQSNIATLRLLIKGRELKAHMSEDTESASGVKKHD